MVNFTSNTYQMKREILSFSNKISSKLSKPERKFIADMNYGILASGSCLLTDIVDQLHEPSKKINIVDRLSRHLLKGTPKAALKSYLLQVRKWCLLFWIGLVKGIRLSEIFWFLFSYIFIFCVSNGTDYQGAFAA